MTAHALMRQVEHTIDKDERRNIMSASEIIKQYEVENIEGYCLVNNYGYTFAKDGRRYDARFWANCYGASPMVWEVTPLHNEDEKGVLPKPDWATELEGRLNSNECSERS